MDQGEDVARKGSLSHRLRGAPGQSVESSGGRYGEGAHHAQVKQVKIEVEKKAKEVDINPLEGGVLVSKRWRWPSFTNQAIHRW